MKLTPVIGMLALGLSACDRADSRQTAPANPENATNSSTETATASQKAEDPHADLSRMDVDKVAELVERKEAVPVDANSEDIRKDMGTLPGAILLSSSKSYELTELPEDKSKTLVFYCGSEKCMAAPKAAKRAEAAGYSNVQVMPAGIRGWVKAGKQVDKSS